MIFVAQGGVFGDRVVEWFAYDDCQLAGPVVCAAAVCVTACGTSHRFHADSSEDASAAPIDAAAPDAGTPREARSLVALFAQPGVARLVEIPLSGPSREMAEFSLERTDRALIFSPGPDPTKGIVWTRRDTALEEHVSWVVDLSTSSAVELAAAIDAGAPGSSCGRPWSIEPRWRSDGRGMFVTCGEFGPPTGQLTSYHLDEDGSVAHLGACTQVWTTTDDNRALLKRDCGEPRYAVFDPQTGVQTPVAGVREGERIHYWDPQSRGWVISTQVERDGDFDFRSLRWLSEDGNTTRLLRSRFPFVPFFLAPSPNGNHLLVATRIPGTGIITAITAYDLRGTAEVQADVPRCTTVDGVPFVRWSPNGDAFVVACEQDSWIVDLDGDATPIAAPKEPAYFHSYGWSPDGSVLLRFRDVGWDLVDPDTGGSFPLPTLNFDELPNALTWRQSARYISSRF